MGPSQGKRICKIGSEYIVFEIHQARQLSQTGPVQAKLGKLPVDSMVLNLGLQQDKPILNLDFPLYCTL